MVEISEINSLIVALWNKYFPKGVDAYAPLFYGELKQGGLLFIGMNPSFSATGIKRVVAGTEHANINPESFYKWSSEFDHYEDIIAIDHQSTKTYPYFKQMDSIAKTIGMPFQHADCFLYRCTSQKEFLERILDSNKLNEFGKDQLCILTKVIETIKPEAIVVANAFASKTLREYFKNSLTFNHEKGYHLLNDTVPIFFSSMLTGARALDTGSRERLVWHVSQAGLPN